MKRVKAFFKRLDERLGAWLVRKYPKLARSMNMGGAMGFDADLQIKVIRGKHNEKNKLHN